MQEADAETGALHGWKILENALHAGSSGAGCRRIGSETFPSAFESSYGLSKAAFLLTRKVRESTACGLQRWQSTPRSFEIVYLAMCPAKNVFFRFNWCCLCTQSVLGGMCKRSVAFHLNEFILYFETPPRHVHSMEQMT